MWCQNTVPTDRGVRTCLSYMFVVAHSPEVKTARRKRCHAENITGTPETFLLLEIKTSYFGVSSNNRLSGSIALSSGTRFEHEKSEKQKQLFGT